MDDELGVLMARIRTIKPEFWDSPSTAQASLAARLLFIAMWNWADDWGVGSANMKSLAAFAFPNDVAITAKELPSLAKEVADCYGVVFYEANRRPFYAIPSWDTHQRTERKAKRLNPAPPEGVSAGQTVNAEVPTHNLGTSDASEGNAGDGTGEQGNRGTGEQKDPPTPRLRGATLASFDTFWAAYPNKKGKIAAEKSYRRALRVTDAETILLGLKRSKACDEWTRENGRFIPHPTAWLNQGRWDDEVAAAANETTASAGIVIPPHLTGSDADAYWWAETQRRAASV